jgi:hypothetical protein
MDSLIVARSLHVLGVIIWIGGLWMVTTVVLPAIRNRDLGPDLLFSFHAIERRFVWHARAAVLLVGVTGFYMVATFDLWVRFADPAFWWMHVMITVWAIFAVLLFAGEPLVLHRLFPGWVGQDPDRTFTWFHRAHVLLLIMSLLTALIATAGAHGWQFP